MTAAIETHKLTKWYGRSRGIIDVDLVVETGQIFGFLGPNGAGKSTTIRLLFDLIRPKSGSAPREKSEASKAVGRSGPYRFLSQLECVRPCFWIL